MAGFVTGLTVTGLTCPVRNIFLSVIMIKSTVQDF